MRVRIFDSKEVSNIFLLYKNKCKIHKCVSKLLLFILRNKTFIILKPFTSEPWLLCARSARSSANYSRSGSRERMQLFLVLLLQHPWWNSEFTESWLFSFYWQRNCKLNYSQGSSVNYFHRSAERRWQKINIQPHCFCNEEKNNHLHWTVLSTHTQTSSGVREGRKTLPDSCKHCLPLESPFLSLFSPTLHRVFSFTLSEQAWPHSSFFSSSPLHNWYLHTWKDPPPMIFHLAFIQWWTLELLD